MKKIILLFLLGLCLPVALWAQAKVLVDAIPTAATYIGSTPITLPFKDAASEDPKQIEAGLNEAVNGILPAAAQQGISSLCLLATRDDQPIGIRIAAAQAELKLSRTRTVVLVLFYRDGHAATSRVDYSLAKPGTKTGLVSTTFQKISVPAGSSTADWVYYNLPRIQAEAEKAKSPVVFLSAGGSGPATAVLIPGLKEPLMVPEDHSTLTATWYMSAEMAAAHQSEILGHPLPADGAKAKP